MPLSAIYILLNRREFILDRSLNKCTVCSNSFTGSSNLPVNERIHSGEVLTSVSNVEKVLVVHQVLINRRTLKLEWNFTSANNVTAFAQSSVPTPYEGIHSGEKPYKCKIKNAGNVFLCVKYKYREHESFQMGENNLQIERPWQRCLEFLTYCMWEIHCGEETYQYNEYGKTSS